MSFIELFKGVSAKFLILVGIGIASLSLVVGTAIYSFKDLSSTVQLLVDSRIPIATLVGDLRAQTNAISKQLFRASIIKETDDKKESLIDVSKRLEIIDESLDSLSKQDLSAENLDRIHKILATWDTAKHKVVSLLKLLTATELPPDFTARIFEDTQELDSINTMLREISAKNEKRNAAIKQEAFDKISASSNMLFIFTGTAYGLLLLLGIWMAISIKKSLSSITTKIAETGAFVGGASTELSGASQNLSTSQTETAASLEETVASVEELTSIVTRNAEQANTASELSSESAEVARLGKQEVQKLITSVQGIAESSKKIDEIINIIDDIAFQTNLLALNAAVEAARAGEQGKGFAVVAEAVRALAHRSSSAAKDISSLISQSVSQSNEGAKLAVQSGEVLDRVTNSIQKVAEINKEMAAASQEQASGLKQISEAMNQLDQATQGNSAAAEQTAATSEEMSQQADTLNNLVHDLQRVIEGRINEVEQSKISFMDNRTQTTGKVHKAKKHELRRSISAADTREIGDASGF